ncbi:LLM class flavin-dependent oxidoreductase [Sphingobium sp. Sx8-8]|uniref:LLM class flavin-dependent oxidoreductase n=1 Tax=Sphingobium sp. Sx8-8 TaxID=2933617 RepID=UPI001F58EEA4|nr:LLM class flavin-dependent oxidoreductase [Sphingobium sp. Sx8-8]
MPFFMADHLAMLNMPSDALKPSHTVTSFEPFTLLSALASTTYDAPFHVARRFVSLDHLSEGRAGWNVVTTGNPETSHNFGSEEHLAHAARYARAREFYDDAARSLRPAASGKPLLPAEPFSRRSRLGTGYCYFAA